MVPDFLIIESTLILIAVFGFAGFAFIHFTRKGSGFFFACLMVVALGLWSISRVLLTRHAPFAGAYEAVLFFSFLYALKTLLLNNRKRTSPWLFLPVAVFCVLALLLPVELKQPNALVPALQSFWIFIHVPAFFLGYVSLTTAFILVIRVDTKTSDEKAQKIGLRLECGLALFFLSLGMITGAIWADEAWGRFWSWDPKETWALITWILLSLATHVNSGRVKTALIWASIFAMLFTFFGVMFLLPGLHSYA